MSSATGVSRLLGIGLLVSYLLAGAGPSEGGAVKFRERPEPSSMGALFMGQVPWPPEYAPGHPGLLPTAISPLLVGGDDIDVTPGVTRFQSETTIASYGDTLVVGFNDASGFSLPVLSASGFAWSHDGGLNYTYGGTLPATVAGEQVRGDPDVKVWVNPGSGQATWVYSSLYRTPGGASSLCVHVSTDGGVTWTGPRVATPINSTLLFADKEFIDLDPETGRLLMSWTSFGTSVDMRCIRSDDFGLTWSPVTVFAARAQDGQGSCPRFDPTSGRAYIVWRAFDPSPAVSFVRSVNNGVTWQAPTDIVSGVVTPLPPYGSDRINGFPALDVSPVDGSLHLIYASMGSDFGDVLYASSSDSGATWSAPAALNADPGNDRAQFFPWIHAADDGGLDATWSDQSAGTEGSDLTEVMVAHSEDGGATWSCPVPVTSRPYHAEYGQDTGQPNIGDYNQVTSRTTGGSREIHASYARNDAPDYVTTHPDAYVGSGNSADAGVDATLGGIAVADVGCEADGILVEDEHGTLTLTLRNRCAIALTGASVTLTTSTPGVTLTDPTAAYPTIPALGTAGNADALSLRLDDTYPSGEGIELRVTGTSDQGDFRFDMTFPTGVVDTSTVLLSEGFEIPSGLPAGWSHQQLRGVSNPWAVSSSFAASGAKSVRCVDWADTSWSRLRSPSFAVPVGTDYLEVSFAVSYDIEELGNGRQGYDGALLRLNVNGVEVLAGAFSTLFEGQYRTQIVRGSGPQANPLQDLAAWAGTTLPTFETIRIRFPGLAGKTVYLIYDMASDITVGGTGIFVDDVVVRALDLGGGTCTAAPALAVTPEPVTLPQAAPSQTECGTVTIHNPGTGFLDVLSVTGCTTSPYSLDLTGLDTEVFPGDSTTFQVCITGPTYADTCYVVVSTNAGDDTTMVVAAPTSAVPEFTGPGPFRVLPPRPNPFSSRSAVEFAVPGAGPVWADVYALSGERVRTLLSGAAFAEGVHRVEWDGRDDRGIRQGSGIYFIRVRTREESRTARAVLLGP